MHGLRRTAGCRCRSVGATAEAGSDAAADQRTQEFKLYSIRIMASPPEIADSGFRSPTRGWRSWYESDKQPPSNRSGCARAASSAPNKIGDGGQPAVVAVLVDAQTLLCLGDGSSCNFDLLPARVQVVISAPDFKANCHRSLLASSPMTFSSGALPGEFRPFCATLEDVELHFDPAQPVVAATARHERWVVHFPSGEGVHPRAERRLGDGYALLLGRFFGLQCASGPADS